MSSFFLPRFKSRAASNNNTTINEDANINENAIQIIKQIGERHGEECRNFDSRKLSYDIKILVNLMKRNRKDKHVQRVALHTISNMAIHQEKCPIIIKHNAHRCILQVCTFIFSFITI